jgi:glyoxylate/hydroxypyruvate reductase A
MPDFEICDFNSMGESDCLSAEVAIVANPDLRVLSKFPTLKWVQSLSAGVDKLLPELNDTSIEIVRLVDPQLAETMAEAALAWCLYLHRNMPQYSNQQKQATWKQIPASLASEQTVSVLGLGQLGLASALRLSSNGFNVMGWSRSGRNIHGVQTKSGSDGLSELLAETNILISMLPSTPDTQELLNFEALETMPQKASFINFGRADVVNLEALTHHLDSGHLAHAVLDVFDVEPLPAKDPIWSHPSITILPHIAAPTNHQTAAKIVARNLNNWFETGSTPTFVSKTKGY